MAAITVHLSASGLQASAAEAKALLRAAPYRAEFSRARAKGRCAMAVGDAHVDPEPEGLWSEHPDLLVASDARLFNRTTLLSELGLPTATPTAELLGVGWIRWGARLPEHLVGDFAFAVWDSKNAELFWARDPIGARPLFWSRTKRGLIVATDIEQILPSATPWELNSETVEEFSNGRWTRPEATFFRGIHRLPGGHRATHRNSKVESARYFCRPTGRFSGVSADTWVARVRRRLEEAVLDRLETEDGRPTAMQLSGGLDSSSIAAVANQLHKTGRTETPLLGYTATFPGLPCDESRYVDAIAARLSQVTVEAFDARGFREHAWESDLCAHPIRDPAAEINVGCLDRASEQGARVLLSGVGGDELFFEEGLFRDLLGRGALWTLLQQTILGPKMYSSRSRLTFLKAAASPWAPRWLRSLREQLHRHRSLAGQAPSPSRARALESSSQRHDPVARGHWTAEMNWRWLTKPQTAWVIEFSELQAARRGMELRLPFLDSRLITTVLLGPRSEIVPDGLMKRSLRLAVADLLPSEVLERRSITEFSSNRALALEQAVRAKTVGDSQRGRTVEAPRRPGEIRVLAHSGSEECMRDWDIAALSSWRKELVDRGLVAFRAPEYE